MLEDEKQGYEKQSFHYNCGLEVALVAYTCLAKEWVCQPSLVHGGNSTLSLTDELVLLAIDRFWDGVFLAFS